MIRLFILIAVTALATACASNGGSSGQSKSSIMSDLQTARLEASGLDARKLMFEKVKWTVGRGDAAIEYEAYYSDDVLRVLEEATKHGATGQSERDYYLNSRGRLFYYTASDEHAKSSGKEKARMRIAFDDRGKMVGAEKSVNGRAGSVSEADAAAVKARLAALHKTADASRRAGK